MHEVLVNRLGGLSLPRKSVVRLTDRPDMTLDVYRGCKTTIQYNTQDLVLQCGRVRHCCICCKEALATLERSGTGCNHAGPDTGLWQGQALLHLWKVLVTFCVTGSLYPFSKGISSASPNKTEITKILLKSQNILGG